MGDTPYSSSTPAGSRGRRRNNEAVQSREREKCC